VGVDSSYGLGSNGSFYSWGSNWAGQLGQGGTGDLFVPTPIAQIPSSGIEILEFSCTATCMLRYKTIASQVLTTLVWGLNTVGQIGMSTTTNQLIPITAPTAAGEGNIIGVASGLLCTYYLFETGNVYASGDNTNGQLGVGGFPASTSKLIKIQSLSQIGKVYAGYNDYAIAITLSGDLFCWGLNSNGQLGLGHTQMRLTPTPLVLPPGKLTNLVLGGGHNIAMIDNQIWVWGFNAMGQLGFPDFVDRLSPTLLGPFLNVTSIDAGYYHTNIVGCFGGFIGLDCTIPYCSLNCTGRGICKSYNNCTCQTGYLGAQCEIIECFGVTNANKTCNGNGACNAPNSCTCSNGYFGIQCEIPPITWDQVKAYVIPVIVVGVPILISCFLVLILFLLRSRRVSKLCYIHCKYKHDGDARSCKDIAEKVVLLLNASQDKEIQILGYDISAYLLIFIKLIEICNNTKDASSGLAALKIAKDYGEKLALTFGPKLENINDLVTGAKQYQILKDALKIRIMNAKENMKVVTEGGIDDDCVEKDLLAFSIWNSLNVCRDSGFWTFLTDTIYQIKERALVIANMSKENDDTIEDWYVAYLEMIYRHHDITRFRYMLKHAKHWMLIYFCIESLEFGNDKEYFRQFLTDREKTKLQDICQVLSTSKSPHERFVGDRLQIFLSKFVV
jgi:alpha-tubulin suppressor-like RCC1 family protein